MKWNSNFNLILKQCLASVAMFTVCFSPLAQAAEAKQSNKELINQYLKGTGLTKNKMTVGEFWKMVRPVYPKKLQGQLDTWVSSHQDEMMPAISATTFKDASGTEQVRLLLAKEGESLSLTFTGDENTPIKFNAVPLTKDELNDYDSFNAIAEKISALDPKVLAPSEERLVLTADQFRKMSPQLQAEYLLELRATMEAAQRVFDATYGPQASIVNPSKFEWAMQWALGEQAFASSSLAGKRCIVAGYISVYGTNNSCGGKGPGAEDLERQMSMNKANCGSAGDRPCNPLVYGFQENGNAFCVSNREMQRATSVCNKRSPASSPADKKRIVESFAKVKIGESNEVSKADFDKIKEHLNKIDELANSAEKECSTALTNKSDQKSACDELKTRIKELKEFAVKVKQADPGKPPEKPSPEPPKPDTPKPPIAQIDCAKEGPTGSQINKDGKCVCPAGQELKDNACVVPEEPVTCRSGQELVNGKCVRIKPPPKECDFWCKNKNWMVPVGAGLAGLGLFWWMTKQTTKDLNKPPVYVPPAPVTPTPGTPSVVTPPLVQPPPAPAIRPLNSPSTGVR